MTENEIEWTSDFLIGIEELDFEHKDLIKTINRLHQELAEHADTADIKGTLGDIHVRMQSHFALEEHVMQEHKYPYYTEHRLEHVKLLDTLTEQMVKYESDPDSVDFKATEDTLKTWIVHHILNSDKKMTSMFEHEAAIGL